MKNQCLYGMIIALSVILVQWGINSKLEKQIVEKENEILELVKNSQEKAIKKQKEYDEKLQQVMNDEHDKQSQLNDYISSLDSANTGLHEKLEAMRRNRDAEKSDTAECKSEQYKATSDMLGGLLEGCYGELAEVAKYADRVRIAGEVCEGLVSN